MKSQQQTVSWDPDKPTPPPSPQRISVPDPPNDPPKMPDTRPSKEKEVEKKSA